jgi:hypothetical protein
MENPCLFVGYFYQFVQKAAPDKEEAFDGSLNRYFA